MREGGIVVVKNPFCPPLVVQEVPPPAEMPLPGLIVAAGVRGCIDLEGLDAGDKVLDLEGPRRTRSGCGIFCGLCART